MAFTPFPQTLDVKTLDTSEAYQICSFTTPYYQEITHAKLMIYVHGSEAGTEQIRVKIYSDSGMTQLIDTSAWANLADREAIGTNDINSIRLDFNRKILAADTAYYAALESQSYTRNSDTFYIGVVLHSDENWMESPANSNIPMDAAVFQVFGRRAAS